MVRTAPNILDLLNALAGGAAAAYALITPRLSSAFIGVALATALVPPLASCRILLLARGDIPLAGGAFLLAFTNIVGIQFAASLVIMKRLLLPNIITVSSLLLLWTFLGNNLRNLANDFLFESSVTAILKRGLADYPGTFLAEVRFSRDEEPNKSIVRALIRGPQEITAQQVGVLEDQLPRPPDGKNIELRLRQIPTTIMTRGGPLFSDRDRDLDTGANP